MKILVTGTTGQLARSLAERSHAHYERIVVPVGRPELDLAEPASIQPAIDRHQPDAIVSAAAYTAVDRAESEPERARAINVEGPAELARAAERLGIPIVHVSSDYVFSGGKGAAYVETDPTAPLSVYGRTKLEGEHAVRAATDRHVILRTSWVFSPFGTNFVRTMLHLAASGRNPLHVVSDQFGSPTSALDLADAILDVTAMARLGRHGLFHLCNRGSASRADFARCILAASAEAGGPVAAVNDIPARGYPTQAPRPRNSSLDCTLFEETFGWSLPDWQSSTASVVQRILADEALAAAS